MQPDPLPEPTETDALVEAYLTGASVASLARDYNLTWEAVADILRQRGVYEGTERTARTKRAAQMAEMYANGSSQSQIAAAFGCSVARVCQIFKEHGIKARPSGTAKPGYANLIPEMRAKGLSAAMIAAELDIHVSTVRKWLKQYGLNSQPGSTGTGPDHQAWKGGTGRLGKYKTVWLPKTDPFYEMAWKNGYVMEHRIVMARKLGRALTRSETVHHINGDVEDNNPENLQLRQGRHGKGVAHACVDCGSHNVKSTRLPDHPGKTAPIPDSLLAELSPTSVRLGFHGFHG